MAVMAAWLFCLWLVVTTARRVLRHRIRVRQSRLPYWRRTRSRVYQLPAARCRSGDGQPCAMLGSARACGPALTNGSARHAGPGFIKLLLPRDFDDRSAREDAAKELPGDYVRSLQSTKMKAVCRRPIPFGTASLTTQLLADTMISNSSRGRQ